MNIPDRLPDRQERSLLMVRTVLQNRNIQVLGYSYELGTGSISLIFGIKKQVLGRVVKEDGTRIWLGRICKLKRDTRYSGKKVRI